MKDIFGYILVVLTTALSIHLITRGAPWLRK